LINTKEIDENARIECLFAFLILIRMNYFANGGLQRKARLKMTEEILTNLYKIEIPLPGSPLKALNSFKE
jgi:hypothetical protein